MRIGKLEVSISRPEGAILAVALRWVESEPNLATDTILIRRIQPLLAIYPCLWASAFMYQALELESSMEQERQVYTPRQLLCLGIAICLRYRYGRHETELHIPSADFRDAGPVSN
jgi:hypothetical protein